MEQTVGLKTCFENNLTTQIFSLNTISEHNFFLFVHNSRTQFSLWTQSFFFKTQFQNNFSFICQDFCIATAILSFEKENKILISKFTPSYLESSLELPWFEGMKQCWSGTYRPCTWYQHWQHLPRQARVFSFFWGRRVGGIGFLLLPMCSYEVLTFSLSSSQWVPNIFPNSSSLCPISFALSFTLGTYLSNKGGRDYNIP
jgi:hypothetical protein